ncbi:transcriptional regulator, MarR family [Pseudodesulfovibrio mercurii]|uniref:Transcriptional regulator, MarR family n=1 Tax=Pseudodesulfovibrio mercurii TaxID=641491 RepID=F0JCF2_9BACT|nr:MarR family winged helix-turn-helix transcriptional regulator [Pseudodesulfovibrio mercurii]EGB14450.1 transcriptional regulator, MarR family [Pseudodesulfovibrio mercurii]
MHSDTITAFDRESPGRRFSLIQRLSLIYLSGPMSGAGVSKGKIPYLMKILSSPGIVQEDLTNHLCLDRAATARALQSLENDGLIRREEDPRDRRRKNVYPTPKAEGLQEEMIAILKAHNDVLLSGFTGEERNLLMSLLDRVTDNLRRNLDKPRRNPEA